MGELPLRSMLLASHLDWVALAVGTVGTVLWARGKASAKYAAGWLASSLGWMAFSWAKGLPALGFRDGLSVTLYVYGGWNALVRDRKTRADGS